jgi:hypothetical protein
MGFGSYDESEQQNQEVNTDDNESEGVSVHENDHEGELTFESGSSVDDLVTQLKTIKTTSENEE